MYPGMIDHYVSEHGDSKSAVNFFENFGNSTKSIGNPQPKNKIEKMSPGLIDYYVSDHGDAKKAINFFRKF